MGKQMNPAVVATIIGVVVVLIAFAIWKTASSGGYEGKTDPAGTAKMQEQMKKTGHMPGIMVPVKR